MSIDGACSLLVIHRIEQFVNLNVKGKYLLSMWLLMGKLSQVKRSFVAFSLLRQSEKWN